MAKVTILKSTASVKIQKNDNKLLMTYDHY